MHDATHRSSLVLVIGAGSRVGTSTLARSLARAAARHSLDVALALVDLGSRVVGAHEQQVVERLTEKRASAQLVVVDCAGEREALLLAAVADVCVLVTTPHARTLQEAARRAQQLAARGVTSIRVVINHAESQAAGRVAFSFLVGTARSSGASFGLDGVVAMSDCGQGARHDGPAARPRGEAPCLAAAASAILGVDPDASQARVPETTLWGRLFRKAVPAAEAEAALVARDSLVAA